jgi:hypothetical protein
MVKQQDPGGNADGAGVPLYLGIDIGTSGPGTLSLTSKRSSIKKGKDHIDL